MTQLLCESSEGDEGCAGASSALANIDRVDEGLCSRAVPAS